ncbi:MAG: phosphoribosylglycinamide formyltransferase [Arcticibacter sp.]
MKKVAVFASGSGSNAENLIRFFSNSPNLRVVAVYSNNPNALVLERIKPLGVPGHVIGKTDMLDGSLLKSLQSAGIDLIVLAGFLKLVPAAIIQGFHGPIINLHPSLLPAYGGKGMHGIHVHEAVIAANEQISGITIHNVNDQYDQGAIIKQFTTEIEPGETPSSLAQKIHELEMRYFPSVVEEVALKMA